MKPTDRDRRRYHAEVRQALERARELTMKFNHDHLGSEHLLGSLLRDDTGSAARLLRDLGTEPRTLTARLLGSFVPGSDIVTASRLPRTPCLTLAVERAEAVADEMGHREVDARHLLIGIAAGEGLAADVLREADVTVERLRSRIGAPGRSAPGDGGAAPAGNGAGPAC